MRLPEVASRLRELAYDLSCDELIDLANEIGRRPIERRAPVTSSRMTDALREEIVAIREAEPALSLAEISHRVNVNPGRVSETLRGYRV